VIFCPAVKGCCSSAPCGCKDAIHRDHKAAVEAAYARSCQRAPDCPVVGCMLDEAVGATCEDGRCVALDGPGGP
jgi:hypothetical protein